jgi:hypothetical protein
MNQQLQDDLKLVSDFMGDRWPFELYQTSWDYQIPVWAKLVKNQSPYNALIGDEIEYYKCIVAERPDMAFEIIVSNIKKIKQ